MREIKAQAITQTIAGLCQEANLGLPDDVLAALQKAQEQEESPLGKEALSNIITNARLARESYFTLCQDCGTAVVFLEVGQDVHITGGDLNKAVEEGVRQGYTKGYLRKSIVRQPFTARVNTKDNTPPVVHTEIVPGDRLKITVMAKGAGTENMSRLAMLKPGEGREGVVKFVVGAVSEAGGSPCPPVIVGVGIGGTSETAMFLSKKTLLRKVGEISPDPDNAMLEKELLEQINNLGIGPQGFGGRVTALAVHVEAMPTHIGSLPVAVNYLCHSARYKEAIL